MSGRPAMQRSRTHRFAPRRSFSVESSTIINGAALGLFVVDSSVAGVLRTLVVVTTTVGIMVMRRGSRPADVLLLGFGLAGLIAGVGAGLHHAKVAPTSLRAVTGVALVATGLLNVVVSTRRLIRPLRRWRKLVAVPIGLVVLATVVMPLSLAVFVTNTPYFPLGDATPADRGFNYEDVTLTTSDGVELDAWYLPSVNGAAIVLLGGCCSARDDQLDNASLLARHGYGVLMLDVRGRGGSGGHAMLWGWWGEIDVRAGVDYLTGRPDVVDGRIGALGMSVGGEQVMAAAGADQRIRAVVAEGVTARGAHDEGDPARGVGGSFIRYMDWASRSAASLMTSADTPTQLRDAVRAMSQQRVLVIAAGTLPAEIAAAATFEALSPTVVTTWIAPGARHTKAYVAHPAEWEQRVVGFYDEELRAA
jgi:hypothetical protein